MLTPSTSEMKWLTNHQEIARLRHSLRVEQRSHSCQAIPADNFTGSEGDQKYDTVFSGANISASSELADCQAIVD
eukprot:scaffold225747_cov18-Tisochrysis_lutea.AAC.1